MPQTNTKTEALAQWKAARELWGKVEALPLSERRAFVKAQAEPHRGLLREALRRDLSFLRREPQEGEACPEKISCGHDASFARVQIGALQVRCCARCRLDFLRIAPEE